MKSELSFLSLPWHYDNSDTVLCNCSCRCCHNPLPLTVPKSRAVAWHYKFITVQTGESVPPMVWQENL